MARCSSPSVGKVSDSSIEAKKAVEAISASLDAQHEELEIKFSKLVEAELAAAKVDDEVRVTENRAITVDYTSEFNLDAVGGVVKAVLKVVANNLNVGKKADVLSDDTVEALTNVVSAIVEAGRFQSASAGAYSFDSNRLAPGMRSFVYATSISVKDKRLFGSEAITGTVVYYRVIESIKELKQIAKFSLAFMYATSITTVTEAQGNLLRDVLDEKIEWEEYEKRSGRNELLLTKAQTNLDKIEDSEAKTAAIEKAKAAISTYRSQASDLMKKAGSSAQLAPLREFFKAKGIQ